MDDFIDEEDMVNALKRYTKNADLLQKVLIDYSLNKDEISYIKAINANLALVVCENGQSKECKIMLKSKHDVVKDRVKQIMEKRR